MTELTKRQQEAVRILRDARLDSNQGMPKELFLLISGLIPLANVDLLITNEQGQLLLTRREDRWYQPSWHIPGGCMHYGESFEHCVQETAKRELGTNVILTPTPIAVRNVIRGVDITKEYPRERGHNVAILFACRLPKDWEINNGTKVETDDGYAKWFDVLPKDFMKIQLVYQDVLKPWRIRKLSNKERGDCI